MKTNRKFKKGELFEVVTPFGPSGDLGVDGLFDDCPLCQELKRNLEAGAIEEVWDEREEESRVRN